jgi:general secretion pathway protein D
VLRAALPAVEALQGGTAGGGGGSGAASADSSSPLSRGGASSAAGSTSASGSSTSTAGSTPIAAIAAPSIGGYIQADPASNALIVTAPEPVFRDIRAVVDELDVRRAQVYVESLVVEVDASRALDVGLQWKQLFNISESTVLTLGTVATALETITGTNILSTANLVTLDNEEAKIVVGQNVPFVTGSYATTSSSSTVNPFQTIERKDVGVTLRIRPQIGRNGVIRMAILQESSSVASTSETSGPTTNTRSIETNVAVRDGRIVVLGGLIEDSDTRETDAVPVVSRIPLLGNLFRSLTRTRRKTNLLVFLRPVVMPDDGAADGVTLDRYDRIRARQAALPDDTRRILDGVAAPALPAPPAPKAASARGSSFDPAVPVPASVPAAQ